MNLQAFKESISRDTPPERSRKELLALWEDAKGNWDTAHSIVQKMNTSDAMWVHAYLHREEGDLSNSMYWYHRVNRSMPGITLKEEWEEIAKTLLEREDIR